MNIPNEDAPELGGRRGGADQNGRNNIIVLSRRRRLSIHTLDRIRRGLPTVGDHVAAYQAARFLRAGAIAPLPEDTLQ